MASSYAALASLMRVIHDLEHHPSPPISLDKQLVDSITQHVTHFQEFLQSYNSPPPPVAEDDEEEAPDPLEIRIAGAAYAAEDAIEYHIVDFLKHKRNNKKIKSIDRCRGVLESVIEEMDSIKKVVVDTHKKQKVPVVYDQAAIKNILVPVAPNENLVGCDGILLEIMEKLAGGQLDFQVIPIVGMGGIGKTFLAKNIYTKLFIKERFDISAWATISQHYDTGEILCELLSQATNRKKENLSGKGEDVLGLELHKYLFSRRFLIVVDDMWSIDSWDKIQRFFPNNGNGSRVLVTTRLSQLSSQLNNDYSLHMSFLDKASSWDLFSKTVFGEKSCPPELEEIGEKIVDNCRGLPLSIAVVGGLLKKMDISQASWESIRDNFASVVNMKNDKHCLRLLKLSYNHLPVYIKPCFLYMGVYEEDEKIHVTTLIQLWVSEGFLKPTNGEALETTAKGFLQDLVDRNLILIDELGSLGSLKICKIHDLVRDMCLKECQKEGFFHVVGNCDPSHQGMNAQRRVVIPEDTSKEKVRGDLRFMSSTRSILCERGKFSLRRNLLLLRTLQLHKKSTLEYNDIYLNSLEFRYVNLRHLAVKTPWMSGSLPSISRLWNLHTLIVTNCFLFVPILVADFWKMPQFRHFEFDHGYALLLDPPNCQVVVIMENLHTLKGIRNFNCSEGVVKRIPNIKRLTLDYESDDVDGDTDVYSVGNMKFLCGLESLSVRIYPESLIDFYPQSSITQKITFPRSLKKLSLCLKPDFEWDDMLEKIGSLPHLEKLKLTYGCFGKGKWEIAEVQFPSLKYLKMYLCGGLENWNAAEEDSSILPRLQHLDLTGLKELKKIPFELGNIDTLKRIELLTCGERVVTSVKEMFDEQVELQGGEDQLSFHVVVNVGAEHLHLMSLAGTNFYVNLS